MAAAKPDRNPVTYRHEFTGSDFVRIVADDGSTTREVAICQGYGNRWPQAVKDAELIVKALNALAAQGGEVSAFLASADERISQDEGQAPPLPKTF